MIRLADIAARHQRVAADVEARVLEVLRSGRYIGGPVVDEATARIANAFGWRHGVGVNSGTDALVYAIQALGVPRGAEVIVPAVTFFATVEAVERAGAVAVVADVRPDLPLLDPDRLPLTPRTALVIAVHLFGERCALPALPVPILDDSAQAIGASPAIRTGIAAAASFYPSKTLGAGGDGGIVLTDDPEMAGRARQLTHHGMVAPHVHERVHGHIGGNSRLDAVQAAILLGHLPDLPARVARRQQTAARYDQELPDWVSPLPRSSGHPVHQYVLRVPVGDGLRDRLRAHLAEATIETAVYYPHPVNLQPALRGAPRCPCAEAFCASSLALPVHEGLSDAQVEQVIGAVRRFNP